MKPLPPGYRPGVITAITVVLGFSLLFVRSWTFEMEGAWTPIALTATGLLSISVLLQFVALWRSLQVRDDDESEYRITLRWFLGATIFLLLSLLIGAVSQIEHEGVGTHLEKSRSGDRTPN